MRKDFGSKTYLFPQPVMIIGTYDENGNPDAMNAAWGGICGADEIMVDLGSHKTTDNLAITGAFTVGIADREHVIECDYLGVVSGRKEPDTEGNHRKQIHRQNSERQRRRIGAGPGRTSGHLEVHSHYLRPGSSHLHRPGRNRGKSLLRRKQNRIKT